MIVKLLKTIYQGKMGTIGLSKQEIKETNPDPRLVKVSRRNGRQPVIFEEGATVGMSDASAKKYIDKKWAVPVK